MPSSELITFRNDDVPLFTQWRGGDLCKNPTSSWEAKFCVTDHFTKVTECTDAELLMKLYLFYGQNSELVGPTKPDIEKYCNAFLDMFTDVTSLETQLTEFKQNVALTHELKTKFSKDPVIIRHTAAIALTKCAEKKLESLKASGGRRRQKRTKRRRTTKRCIKKKRHSVSSRQRS